MTPEQVAASWRRAFGEVAPIGHLCRGYLQDRWLRIHSLPESKRYAETEMEYAEILRRHNQVASKILGDRECILFVTSFDGGDGDHYSTPFPVLKSASYVRIPQLDALYDDEDQIWIRVCGAALRWSEGEFEGLLREVADARGPHVLFADLETGRAYAPYDGGADIFVESRAAADELKQLWTEWLSARSDGL